MKTTCRSSTGSYLPFAFVVAALLLILGFQSEAQAQQACGPSIAAPQCDGYCPGAGLACVDTGGSCECVPSGSVACGGIAGFPQCWGECPSGTPICVANAGSCACVVPTLSEWGIVAMSLVMFGGVLFLRRRQGSRLP